MLQAVSPSQVSSWDENTQKWTLKTGPSATVAWAEQALALEINESNFFADWGGSYMNAIMPEYYLQSTINKLAPFFAQIKITKQNPTRGEYDIYIAPLNASPLQRNSASKTFRRCGCCKAW